MRNSEYVLEMKGIGKEYYGTRVLENINIELKPGEIHAVLGENGAGKSTLMNILFGMSVIHSTGGFEGQVLVEGEEVNIKSPVEAMHKGIGMVHQEFMLIPGYSITENIKLNREITNPSIVSRFMSKRLEVLNFDAMNKDARIALDKLGLNVEEWVRIAGLPVGYMQFVEIAREIDKKNLKVLVFDEPTAVLTENEAQRLLESMQLIASEGIAILFITHRLDEVKQISDRITVLRDGKHVVTKDTKDSDVMEMANLMVGREIKMDQNLVESQGKKKVKMSLRNLYVDMPGEEIKGVDLDIYEGEILGIGGLAGQGKIGLANGIMGLYQTEGEIMLDGKPIKLTDPWESLERGLAFVSEDRRGIGLLLDTSIEMNIVVTAMKIQQQFLNQFGPFSQKNSKAIREHALKMIEELDIRCTGPEQPVKRLSGGNQQKVCIARALTLNPKVLFVSEPTRGIDVGAKKLVLDTLKKLNQEHGMTIIMTSSELAELRLISHRIAIVNEGKLEGTLLPNADDVDFGLMMAGEYQKVKGGEVEVHE
ncbi:monosaccharide ABC transporter ATP-binding protein, CUT2 family [Tindallia magadiensis]|uniref:Monosaccharide ABC transporter ATP-binding protein, CUT2 family n=1 Tax=Tindallia magadiensis TaxID=69895 RepID=A0A1I3EKL3_9FIRM|nr:sugar ABC transporter ATP-binding protein [Tindallia magadiensis]SFH99413.1 monosaccharide ABC transporter ATP-binding protein, CUT2 family [Tindallia magadiensis]